VRDTVVLWARRPWLWLAVVLLVVAVAGAALRFAPMFHVAHIDVMGNDQVSADDVIAAAQVPGGTPLLGLPVDEIESRIETLDAVAAARVARDWPDRVTIMVRERRPVGYVETSGGVALIGSDGSLYREQRRAPTDVPELPPPPAGSTGVGGSYPVGTDGVEQAAFDVAVSLPRPLQRSVAAVSAESARAVRLTFGDGVVVEWGSPAAGEQKATVVTLLRDRHGWGRSFTVVDVTAPEVPALR
jgi:cell division septal protein FtsQ